MLNRRLPFACLLCLLSVAVASAQAPATTVSGAVNFRTLDANFASGGVTMPEAFAELKRLGFRSVINLQAASEPGVDMTAETEAATKAGLEYLHLPLSPSAPEMEVADKFLALAKDQARQPMYIHCRSGQRANALWLIKRVLMDGWTAEKALAEADALKMQNPTLRAFALSYIEKHR